MKLFFTNFFFIFSLFFIPKISLAQGQCFLINASNYGECCTGRNGIANSKTCSEYDSQSVTNPPNLQVGEKIEVPNNFGGCNAYTWGGTKWVLIPGGTPTCKNNDNYSSGPGFIGPVQSGGQTGGTGSGTINSGALPAGNPLNGAANNTGGIIAPTPSSSSSALKSCSAIRFDSLLDILIWLKCIIGSAIIPLMFTIAFLYFLYNMLMFVKGSDNTAKKDEYKTSVYTSIIALVVMVSVWGIVKIVTTTFGLGNTVPELQTDYLKKP
jgi:hypothetical protein